jgi:hypothetical protein
MFVVAEKNAATFVKFIVARIGRTFYKLPFVQYPSVTSHTIGGKPE